MEKQSTSRNLDYYDLKTIDYKEAWDTQKKFHERLYKEGGNDSFFLLEHPHTYTLGKVADKQNLISSEKFLKHYNISVYEIDRGGDITYHGPGQVVGYPILNLSNWKQDTHLYLRALEDIIINVLDEFGIKAGRNEKFTGVWIDNRKICAIGIKVSRWITMHGFAFNVNTDLNLFNGIVPCGIRDKEVTSLQKELNQEFDILDIKKRILKHMMSIFNYSHYIEKSLY